ncbi:glutathione S-transferase domain-containing protein [Tepidicaulis marinus]|uniref:Glutathione S-transferase domain-containing protein n=1 Tax=Tepidicaulis marinus TaxID=1333998 RepID=A0A081BBR6_9HYPH|nr:glutathione S-transferase family protein [Tepidicaulis marinus]GAK45484.1 glutathione S-transferase domain-containing protein [Tepidicaulis marinus]
MAKLTLYEHPLSPYAQKNKMALREKGIDFECVTPDAIGTGGVAAFLEINPRAEVPALVTEDGMAIFDSTIIFDYIEERWPSPPLQPQDPAARARARMIEDVMDTQYEAVNWGLGEIHFFKRAEGKLAETLTENARRQTEGFFAYLENELGGNAQKGENWLTGPMFGRADMAALPLVAASMSFGFHPQKGSALDAWVNRAMQRPSAAQTVEEALASRVGMDHVANAVKQGLFKRQYRDHRLEWVIKSGGMEVVTRGIETGTIRFANDFSNDGQGAR